MKPKSVMSQLVDPEMYTHVSTDDKKTVLKHKNGHELTVVHSALLPRMQAQLKALQNAKTDKNEEPKNFDEGGKVPAPATSSAPSNSDKQQVAKSSQSGGVPSDSPLKTGNWNVWAKGGPVPHMMPPGARTTFADGGDAKPSPPVVMAGQSEGTPPPVEDTDKMKDVKEGAEKSGGMPSTSDMFERLKHPWAEGGEVAVCKVCGNGECQCNPKLEESKKTPPQPRKMYAEGTTPEDMDRLQAEQKPGVDKRPGLTQAIGEAVGHAINTIFPMPESQSGQDATSMVSAPQKPADPNFNSVTGQQTQPVPPQTSQNASGSTQTAQPTPDSSQTPAPSISQPSALQGQPTSQTQPDVNAQSPLQKLQQDEQQTAQMPENSVKQQLTAENQAFEHDLANGHITPETYQSLFSKQDTLGKIGTLFGLVIAGGGAGLTHQPNAVLEMMNQQIKNDLAAQEKSKDNAQNFLRLNQQHLMNQASIKNMNVDTATKAYALTQAQMLQSAFHKLAQDASKAPEGPQKEQAKLALGALYNQMNTRINNLNDLAVAAQEYYKNFAGPQGPQSGEQNFQDKVSKLNMSGPQGENLAGKMIERHIPGVQGQASKPITEADRARVDAHNQLDNKINDVINFAKQHSKLGDQFNPNVIREGAQKSHELTSFYNKTVDSLGMTQGRMEWLDEQIKKNPQSIVQQLMGNNAALNEIKNSNAQRRDLFLTKTLGFPSQQQFKEGQTGRDNKTGQPVVYRNGKWVRP